MRRFSTAAVLVLVTLLFVSSSSAQQTPITSVPNLIRYSGTLKDAQGAAIPATAPVGVTFAIYNQQDGGAAVWQETQNITPDANGQYSVILGSTTAAGLPDDLFSQQEQRWLGVQAQGEAEQPRVLLVSVPYAFKAHEADTLGGLPASAFVKTETTNDANGTSVSTGSTVTSGNNAASTGVPVVLPPITPTNTIAKFFSTGLCCKGANAVETGGALNVSEPINLTQFNYGYQVFGIDVLAQHVGANVVVGFHACPIPNGTRGTDTENTCVGQSAGQNDTSGGSNTFVGFQAGQNNTTGSNDIYIGNLGASSGTESNAIRIGTSQTAAYLAGVYGGATSSGSPLFVDSTGKLGTGSGTGLVTSFNGRTGAVVPQNGDYNFTQLSGTLQNAQLSGTYTNPLTLNNGSNSFTGSFTGNGAGLTGVLPAGGSPNYIQNGTALQANATFNISGNGTVGGTLAANEVNSATTYQIGGANVLSTGVFPGFIGSNLYVGLLAGGAANNSLGLNYDNVLSGFNAGYVNGGHDNTFSGANVGFENTSGKNNSFYGSGAGYLNTTGTDNVFVGYESGINNTTGIFNVYIANQGPFSGAENNAIRIGDSEFQTATYIAGIYNVSLSPPYQPVVIDSTGHLGSVAPNVSSLRFKDHIADMGDSSSKLFQLRPVTFFYKPQYDDGPHALQYGLIAEEVAKVYPEMVAYDKDGQPYTVKYQYLAPMLLNELQKQHAVVSAQQDMIQTQQEQVNAQQQQMQAQQQQIEQLQQRLSRLESLIANK
jgi:hypothetical protein